MGKTIKDGFHWMEYVNAHLIRKIDDIPELKHEFITISESKTHMELSKYVLLLAEHILEVSGTPRSDAIEECFSANTRWLNKQAYFQEGRQRRMSDGTR